MKNYRYTLQPYKGYGTRFICPSCRDRRKTLVRYIDNATGEHVHDTVGKCDRIDNCGYHCNPKQYFESNGIDRPIGDYKAKFQPQKPKPISCMPKSFLTDTMVNYGQNNFITYLLSLPNCNADIVKGIIEKYFIGTSTYWNGATIFYQIDSNGNIRGGKVMLYDANTGKRVKSPFNHINWLHTAFKMPDYNLLQCYFGEHLIRLEPKNTIAIVESEKTAIIASMHFPLYTWLACSGKEGLNEAKLRALKGRRVILYPDLGSFEKWQQIANENSHIAEFIVSDILEVNATPEQKAQGLDLADFLVK